MSVRERRNVRRNTTVLAIAMLYCMGLFLFWFSLYKGISAEDSTWCLYLFWFLGTLLGGYTWVYETHKWHL